MARLKTINAYLVEIKRLHLAGDSQATTILAKLLAKLEQNIKQASFNATLFHRNFFEDLGSQLYNEFSGLWIAFARYYHSIAFNVNDTLQEDFQSIWVSYTEDFGAIAPAICDADFFRKCLIAAELFRRKQNGDYVKEVLAGDNRILKNNMITSLPSFSLPTDLLPYITNYLFKYRRSADAPLRGDENISTALSLLSIQCGNIQELVTRERKLLNNPYRTEISEFLITQATIPGGVPLSEKEKEATLPSRRKLKTIDLFASLFDVDKPPCRLIFYKKLTHDEVNLYISRIKINNTETLKETYANLTLQRVPQDLHPFVIEQLKNASLDENATIKYAALIRLLEFGVDLVLDQLDIDDFFNIVEICAPVLDALSTDFLLSKISLMTWSLGSEKALTIIDNLLDYAFNRIENDPPLSNLGWLIPTMRLLQNLLPPALIPSDTRENIIDFLFYCFHGTSKKHLKQIPRLINEMARDDKKQYAAHQAINNLLNGSYGLHQEQAYIIDKMTPATYAARHEFIASFIRNKDSHYPIKELVEVLLELTRSLPLEHKIQMTSLFSDLLGTHAVWINDCVYGKHEHDMKSRELLMEIEDALPEQVVPRIKQFNL